MVAKLDRGHLAQSDLRPPIVVVIDIIGDFRLDVGERKASPQVEFVLRMAEPAFYRRVVPAIPPPRHRLAYLPVGQVFPIFPGGVMAALIAVQKERLRQPRYAVEHPQHPDHEGHVYRLRERPCDDLVGGCVLYGGKVAPLFAMGAVIEVAYVGEEVLPGPPYGELPVELVGEHRIGLQRLGDPLERIRPSYGAFQAVFPHQPLDFLPVHDGSGEEFRHHHGDRPRAFGPPFVVVDGLDGQEIRVILGLPGAGEAACLPGFIGVVAGSRNAHLGAHPGDVQGGFSGVFSPYPVDYLELFFDGDFDGW